MKLDYITIMVRDIKASIRFYEELIGLRIVREMHPGNGKIVFMANEKDDTMLELIQFEDVETLSVQGMVMSYTSDIPLEALRKKACELGYSPTKIIDQGPKPKYFRVCDPDGVFIEFS